VEAVDPARGEEIGLSAMADDHALTLAALLVAGSYLAQESEDRDMLLLASEKQKASVLLTFGENVVSAAVANALMNKSDPGYVLWILGKTNPGDACQRVFAAIRAGDATLDSFALQLLKHAFDSSNGQTYALPEGQVLESYCALDEFREHAQARLADVAMGNPARAAWRSVVENKTLYWDGSESDR
jgi:hypothetical protein